MKILVFLSFLICLFVCNSVVKKPLSDLESIQIKTSFVDLNNNKVDLTAFK